MMPLKIKPEFLPIVKMTWGGKTKISIMLCSAAPKEEKWIPQYCHVVIAYGEVQVWIPPNYIVTSHYPSKRAALEHALQVGKNYLAQEYFGRNSKYIAHVCAAQPCQTPSGTANRALRLLLQENPGLDVIGELI